MNGFYICPKCQNYFRIPAFQRIEMVTDQNSFNEWDTGLFFKNPLHYKGYEKKLAHLKEKTGLDEAVVTGKATIHGIETAIGVCDSRFIMVSMGEVFGEKITRLVERATLEKLPIVLFICSGGCFDESDYRKRNRKFCNAWRYHSCRTKSSDRICRA